MKIGDRGSGHDDAKEAKAASFLFGAQIRLLPYYHFGAKRVQGGNPRLLAMLTIRQHGAPGSPSLYSFVSKQGYISFGRAYQKTALILAGLNSHAAAAWARQSLKRVAQQLNPPQMVRAHAGDQAVFQA